MKRYLKLAACVAIAVAGAGLCRGQSDAPYTEGSVWEVTLVKTKAGMTDDYLRSIAKTFKGMFDEGKKQNVIMDYKVLLGDASGAGDFDIMLMVEYKNMAALDGLREKFDPVARKVMGSMEQQRDLAVKRFEVRDILGTKTMREIMLK